MSVMVVKVGVLPHLATNKKRPRRRAARSRGLLEAVVLECGEPSRFVTGGLCGGKLHTPETPPPARSRKLRERRRTPRVVNQLGFRQVIDTTYGFAAPLAPTISLASPSPSQKWAPNCFVNEAAGVGQTWNSRGFPCTAHASSLSFGRLGLAFQVGRATNRGSWKSGQVSAHGVYPTFFCSQRAVESLADLEMKVLTEEEQ